MRTKMPKCQGRRTTPKGSSPFFENGPRLHREKPLLYLGIVQCTNEADDLCASCLDRQRSTEYQLVKRAGKYIPNQETMFHGRMGEAIPKWSRLQGGEWYLAQIAAGYTVKGMAPVSVEMEEKAVKPAKKFVRPKKVAAAEPVAAAHNVELVVVAPITDAPVKKTRAKKTVVKAVAAEVPAVPAVIPKKFNPRKKAIAVAPKPVIGIVEATPLDDVTVEKIAVRKTDIGGRALYVSSKKDKVYDLKFKYLGRWNRRDDTVDTSYADSDGGA
jgi:hypothetical protein